MRLDHVRSRADIIERPKRPGAGSRRRRRRRHWLLDPRMLRARHRDVLSITVRQPHAPASSLRPDDITLPLNGKRDIFHRRRIRHIVFTRFSP